MTAPALLCAGAEIALNRYLRLESSVVADCAKLAGRGIEISLRGVQMDLYIEFISTGVRVLPESPQRADVRISGSPTQLMAALRRMASAQSGLPEGLQIEGDAELLDRFRDMTARVGFDPEEWLAPIVGGTAAHRLVGGLKRMFDRSRGNAQRMADHSAEYLREETYDLARGRDVGEWMNEVDDAREALDRIEARLRRLEAHPTAIHSDTRE
ncbi:MAG: ubiquinone biosynthesis accessory factor UbiJ [Panacagrimonas sp.]